MSKQTFRSIIDSKIKIECKSYISSLISNHSKTKNLSISDQIQEYLKCDSLSCKQQILLFGLRVRSADIKVNYHNKFKDNIKCRYRSDQLKSEASKVNANYIFGT